MRTSSAINTQEIAKELRARGWKELASANPWRWREPKTHALYRIEDAWSLAVALDRRKAAA